MLSIIIFINKKDTFCVLLRHSALTETAFFGTEKYMANCIS